MQITQSIIIEGKPVQLKHEGRDMRVYESLDRETLYISFSDSSNVDLKIEIECEMSQGTGYVDNIQYTDGDGK